MRGREIAATVGIGLAVLGVALLAYGILRATGSPAAGDCAGDECFSDPWFVAFPVGIMTMTVGLTIGSWAIGSIRAERGVSGPLRVFGVMTGLGITFVVLGVIFSIAYGQGGPIADGTFLFLGALFGIMGLCFVGIDLYRFRGELRTDRLRVSGIHGTAKVVGVHDSNVTVNNSPMVSFDLDVSIPGQSPFRVRKRTVISRLSVGALMPGAVVPVLADPARPRDVVIDWEGDITHDDSPGGRAAADAMRAFSVGHLGSTMFVEDGTTVMVNGKAITSAELAAIYSSLPGILGAVVRHIAPAPTFAVPDIAPSTPSGGSTGAALTGAGARPAAPQIEDIGASAPPPAVDGTASDTHGAPGRADLPARVTLESIQDTGVDMGGNRLYTFDLTVAVAGREPYPMKHAAVVPQALVPRLTKGASFPARVDPSIPGDIAVQWDR